MYHVCSLWSSQQPVRYLVSKAPPRALISPGVFRFVDCHRFKWFSIFLSPTSAVVTLYMSYNPGRTNICWAQRDLTPSRGERVHIIANAYATRQRGTGLGMHLTSGEPSARESYRYKQSRLLCTNGPVSLGRPSVVVFYGGSTRKPASTILFYDSLTYLRTAS